MTTNMKLLKYYYIIKIIIIIKIIMFFSEKYTFLSKLVFNMNKKMNLKTT